MTHDPALTPKPFRMLREVGEFVKSVGVPSCVVIYLIYAAEKYGPPYVNSVMVERAAMLKQSVAIAEANRRLVAQGATVAQETVGKLGQLVAQQERIIEKVELMAGNLRRIEKNTERTAQQGAMSSRAPLALNK